MGTNLLLALVTSALGLAALDQAVRRNLAALPPVILGALFWVVGVFGHQLWQWSRYSEGAGMPSFFSSEPIAQSPAVPAFLLAAIGAFGASFLLPAAPKADSAVSDGCVGQVDPRDRDTRRTEAGRAHVGRVTTDVGGDQETNGGYLLAIVVLSLLLYSLWCVGEGPSLLRREIYLATDGNDFLLRTTWPASLVVALVVLVVGYVSTTPMVRVAALGMSLVWYLSLLSVGTRMACVFPLILGALVLYRALSPIRRGFTRIRPGGVVVGSSLLVLSIASFGVILTARANPHGLLNLWSLFAELRESGEGVSRPLQQLVSSIAASYPIVEQSMNVHVDPGVLVGNANPLPGTANPAELERLWPYEWVPLSFIGTWYVATGPVGQVALFGVMGWATGQLWYNLQRSRWGAAAYTAMGFSILLGILSIQYSSRMPWRILSVVVALLIIAYVVRDRDPGVRRGRGRGAISDPRPPMVVVAPRWRSPATSGPSCWTPGGSADRWSRGLLLRYCRRS
ncbi:MAG: hypothetical protein QM662_00285 [Gordonia sp. (in: high G+C Gram-positive bacteria)]